MLKVGKLYQSIFPISLRIVKEEVWFYIGSLERDSCFVVIDVYESVHNDKNYIHYQILTQVGVFKTYPSETGPFITLC